MQVSFHAKRRRNATYNVIRKEIEEGHNLQEDFARTLLNREAENRRFRSSKDRYVLRKDLLGMYVLTQKDNGKWIAVTHIDLNDSYRQKVLTKYYTSDRQTNIEFQIRPSLIRHFSVNQISEIKEILREDLKPFEIHNSYPVSLKKEIDFNNQIVTVSMYKKTTRSPIRVGLFNVRDK